MYKIQLQQFEGPLDLLLFFIRRDELDIHDIPISRIADEFLEYVRYMEEIDLDGVGDFLYMAAVLIHIKTRMLLPVQETDEEGEPVDPRRELVERLLEYVRFKEASDHLEEQYDRRERQLTRGQASAPENDLTESDEELVSATVFDLISALRRVLTEAPDSPVHRVETESYSLEDQQEFLRTHLTPGDRSSFVEIMTGRSKPFIITTFLAVLEMARTREIEIWIGGEPDDFFVELADPATETTETLQQESTTE
ncbi:MAG: segregation/condensation protein A [Rhodothermales bacterium]|nr:segregation/condensation protein A [Rhodothermales bacterium]